MVNRRVQGTHCPSLHVGYLQVFAELQPSPSTHGPTLHVAYLRVFTEPQSSPRHSGYRESCGVHGRLTPKEEGGIPFCPPAPHPYPWAPRTSQARLRSFSWCPHGLLPTGPFVPTTGAARHYRILVFVIITIYNDSNVGSKWPKLP